MIYFLFSFLIAEILFCIIFEVFKYRVAEFPKLKITKSGIKFFSFKQHKIKIGNSKVFELGGNFYLKTNTQIIIFKNIKNVKTRNGYMYFISCGNVEIIFNAIDFYKYFNIEINIDKLNFSEFKQTAILDFINNQFNISNSKKLQKFLKFIKNTLKIHINSKNLKIFSNNLKISYQITYKLNNKIKRINIKNTIGKI